MNNETLSWSSLITNLKESKKIVVIIFVLALIIGTLMGAMFYKKQVNNQQAMEQIDSGVNDENVYVLNESEFTKFSADVVTEMYQHKEYYTNSILMHVNPYEIPAYNIALFIKELDQNQNTATLVGIRDSYKTLVLSDECYKYICEKTGIDIEKKYLDELITYNATDAENDGALLQIQIIGKDPEQAQLIADSILDYITQSAKSKLDKIVSHELEIISYEPMVLSDSSLYTRQKNERMASAYYYASGTTESIQNTFRLITDFGKQASTVQPSASVVKYMVNYLIIFMIIGGVIISLYLLRRCYKDKRIYNYLEYCSNERIDVIQASDYIEKKNQEEYKIPLFLFDLKRKLLEASKETLVIASPFAWKVPIEWQTVFEKLEVSVNVIEEFTNSEQKIEEICQAHNVLLVCKQHETTYAEMDYIVKRLDRKKLKTCNMVVL